MVNEVELYGYSRCSSCPAAASLLAEHGVSVSRRDLFAQPLAADEIKSLLQRIGAEPKELLATRSRPYEQLGLRDRSLSDDEVIELMGEHPALLRRPIVIAPSGTHVGFNRLALLRLIASTKDGRNGHA
jgi:Spx/MgsR family transcriptional regulator